MTRSKLLIGLTLAVGMAGAGWSVSAVRADVPEPLTFAGGVIDPANKAAYLRTKADEITAVSLDTGKVLWQTKEAFFPLAVQGKRLFALAAADKGHRIAVLDVTQKGKRLVLSDPLPSGVWIGEGPTTNSHPKGRIEQGQLLCTWRSSTSPFSGVPDIASKVTLHVGSARIDPETGKVKILSDEVIRSAEKKGGPVKLPLDEPEPELTLPKAVEKDLEQFAKGGCWPRSLRTSNPRPLVTAKHFALLTYEKGKVKRQQLVLRTWDKETGKANVPVVLLEGDTLQPLSSDGRHVFLMEAVAKKEPKFFHTWIFALDTGKEVAKLPYQGASVPLMVYGDKLLRHGLSAVELQTGRQLWSQPVYVYRYTGPFPPSAPR